jgi:hypothetical protein
LPTQNAYTYDVDSFAMFKTKDPANQKAQQDLAPAILSPAFQEVFNLNKGSIPMRTGVSLEKFDTCRPPIWRRPGRTAASYPRSTRLVAVASVK